MTIDDESVAVLKSFRWQHLILVGIVGLAAFFRLYRLNEIPPGLHHDEAFECLEAARLLEGKGCPIFFEGNFGVEPLFIYAMAGFFWLWGLTPLAGRLIAALVGTVTVAALYLFVTELRAEENWKKPDFCQQTWFLEASGLLAALVLALLYWHVTFSRQGIEPVLVPLISTLSFYCLWLALRTGETLAFIASGCLLGLGPYAYPAGRVLPFLLVVFLVYRALADRDFLGRHGRGLMWLWGTAFLVFAPLGYYFLTHPQVMALRSGQVGVMAAGQGSQSPLKALADNTLQTLAMFSLRGDIDPRNNLPGRPVLDLFLSVFFLVGLVVSLRRIKKPAYAFLLLWWGAMLLPTVLSEYAPHFRRALGAAPPLAVLIALGLTTFLEAGRWLIDLRTTEVVTTRLAGLVPLLIVGGGLAGSALTTYHDYFTVWGTSPDLYHAFDEDLVDIAHYVRGVPQDETVYLSPLRSDHPTIVFTLKGEREGTKLPRSFDGRRCLVLSAHPEWGATYIVLVDEDDRSLDMLSRYLPDGEVVRRFLDRRGRLRAVAYRSPGGSRRLIAPSHPLLAGLGGVVRLLGYDLEIERSKMLRVTLYWQAQSKMEKDYTVFVHLLGDYNPNTASPLWGQQDGQPGEGTYPTTVWETGEIIIDTHRLPIQSGAPPGEYRLETGLYYLPTMQRVPIVGGEGEGGDSVHLGLVQLDP